MVDNRCLDDIVAQNMPANSQYPLLPRSLNNMETSVCVSRGIHVLFPVLNLLYGSNIKLLATKAFNGKRSLYILYTSPFAFEGVQHLVCQGRNQSGALFVLPLGPPSGRLQTFSMILRKCSKRTIK